MRKYTPLAAMLAAVVLATAGCSQKREAQQTVSTPTAIAKGVVLETVRSTAMPELLEVTGTVRARTSAVVSARIPGSVNLLRVREGDRVRRGQLLIQLDAQENQATAAAAIAGIEEAGRALDEALSRRKLTEATFKRYQNLFNDQAVSRQEFDNRLADHEQAGQGVARAEARLKQAQEGARAAVAVAGYAKIIAPISGVITAKKVDLGATVFPAQPLLTIEDEGSYQLELAIPESMANKVKPGTAVQVSLDMDNNTFLAKISEITPTADPASRTFAAKINLSQKGLRSGMFGRGNLVLGSSVTGMMVSKKALVEHGALTSVWVLDKNNIARMRLIKAGKTLGDKVEILSGLSDGERVVAGGLEKVREGTKVE